MTLNESFSWNCPFCNRTTTITNTNLRRQSFDLDIENTTGRVRLLSTYIVCPNKECSKFALTAELYTIAYDQNNGRFLPDKRLFKWSLIPRSKAKILPNYVPAAIKHDYEEASLILNDSPKASATLSRRCLQGMIRDFWKISKARLFDEINAIEDKVDTLTWQSIDAVRKIGNIGAHMEKDINVIVEVEPHEAELLIQLIELLIDEWYVARHERQQKLEKIIALSEFKTEERKLPKT